MIYTTIIGETFERGVNSFNENFSNFLDFISLIVTTMVEFFEDVLSFYPFIVLILILTLIPLLKGKWQTSIIIVLGMLIIEFLNLETQTIETTSIVLASAFIALIFGVPLGIISAKSKMTGKIVKPILDLMQTMPAFVYLIPAVVFFGLGAVPAVFATVIYAMPPVVRLTTLGINEVDESLKEAGTSFGSTKVQMLFKIELPQSLKTIFTGINQTILLSLSMVVIAAMIGASGLGYEVYRAIQRVDIAQGFESGIAVVALAIILDRITELLIEEKNDRFDIGKLLKKIVGLILILALVIAGIGSQFFVKGDKTEEINFVTVSWDDVQATTEVAKILIEENTDYKVKVTPAEVGIAYNSLSTGTQDVFMGGWLPITHKNYIEKFEGKLEILPPFYTNSKLGLAVPTYMEDINSIEDLKGMSDESDLKINGIDPGSGINDKASEAIDEYGLNYEFSETSTSAMLTELESSIQQEKPVAITGWNPHWMFSKYEIKFLEDPKGVFGEPGEIGPVTRLEFSDDYPKANEIIEDMEFTDEQFSELIDLTKDGDTEEGARQWIAENNDEIEWLQKYTD